MYVAVLNDSGGYIGKRSVPPEEVTDEDVVVPSECDLPENGTYFWNKEMGAFLPEKKKVLAPSIEQSDEFRRNVCIAIDCLVSGRPIPDDLVTYFGKGARS